MVMRQNAMAMNTIREGLAVARPVAALGEIAGEGTNTLLRRKKSCSIWPSARTTSC
jgi:hypothetical protein